MKLSGPLDNRGKTLRQATGSSVSFGSRGNVVEMRSERDVFSRALAGDLSGSGHIAFGKVGPLRDYSAACDDSDDPALRQPNRSWFYISAERIANLAKVLR